MPKGYWIPHIDVATRKATRPTWRRRRRRIEKYSGVALVRGGKMEVVEGRARARVVLREFPDYAAALACYRSPEYQSARSRCASPHSAGDFVDRRGL